MRVQESENRRATLLLIALGFPLLGACTGDETVRPPRNPTNIEGTVATAEGGAYPGVPVALRQGADEIRRQETDDSGSFQFLDVAPGSYFLTIDVPRYTSLLDTEPMPVTVEIGTTAKADIGVRPVPIRGEVTGVDVVTGLGAVIQDASGNRPERPGEPIFRRTTDTEELHPVLSPAGHHVTLEEWGSAEGTAEAMCDGADGTRVTMSFTGLIPHGVYSTWINLVVLQGAGGLVGSGALGRADGSENTFTASGSGTGQLDATVREGPLSLYGAAPNCVLSRVRYPFLLLTYHMDGETVGGGQTASENQHTWVNQMVLGYVP